MQRSFPVRRMVRGDGLPRLEARLAAVESSLEAKPKSLLDRVKDWGGVLSLVIAIGYSFPLGLWKDLVVSREERSQREISELRTAIEDSATLMGESGRALSAISNPNMYDLVARTYSTRLYLLVAKHREMFLRRKDQLSPEELVVVAYNFAATNDFQSSDEMLDVVLGRPSSNPMHRIEALRQKAKNLFAPSPIRDVDRARELYMEARVLAQQGKSPQELGVAVTLISEWGYLEMLTGDWQCGQALISDALKIATEAGPILDDSGMFLKMIAQRTAGLKQRPDQQADGCRT